MKSTGFFGVLGVIAVAAMAAGCKVTVVDGGGGAGGSGATTSSTKAATSSTKAATTANSTVTTGGGSCDNTGACEDPGMDDGDNTNDCLSCAIDGACSGQASACQNSQECIAFINCATPCMDQACYDACITMHQAGADIYNDFLLCAVCQECPVDCDGPGSGCP